ncbi:MAG: alpha/beta hydrolase family protein, partial [Ignavibacteria bacterium]
VFPYDIRGHGNSSKVNYELSKLLSDPDEAPKDLKAIFSWAKTQKGIDTSRISVIGTSIGGNLACYGKYFLGAKTIIGISNGRKGFESFIGIDERMMGRVFPRISSVLLICGSKDGNHEADHKYIMDNFVDEPKELKVYDSEKHGKYLLEEYPEIYTNLLNWLQKYL